MIATERNCHMPEVSVIVPVYKVEPYLHQCVDSILAQTFTDFELILVDDGSPDNCGAICDEYAAQDRRVRVIHLDNGGQGRARNIGMDQATGKYIIFLDSDDYWQHNVLAGLMEQSERDKLDVLRIKYQNVRIKNEGVNELKNEWEYEVFNPYKRDYRLDNDYSEVPTDGVSFLNSRMNTQCYAVMFIIKRDLLEGCLFTEEIFFEDTDWTPRMLARANRVASTATIVYNYLVRIGSISRAVSREKQQKVLDDKIRLVREMQRQAEALRQSGRYDKWYHRMIADTVVSIIGMLSDGFYTDKHDYLKQLEAANIYPITNTSLKARLVNLSPRLAVELLHLKNGHRK